MGSYLLDKMPSPSLCFPQKISRGTWRMVRVSDDGCQKEEGSEKKRGSFFGFMSKKDNKYLLIGRSSPL
jgi:hypothetical protein